MADCTFQYMEEWKEIKGFPKREISNLGRVRSFLSDAVCPRLLKQAFKDKITNRYLRVTFRENGEKARLLVHQLVMEHFGPPKPGPEYEISHEDMDSENNSASNLKWRTHSGNQINRLNPHNSKYHGVCKSFKKKNGKEYWYWIAAVKLDGKRTSKWFPFTPNGEIEAAKWRDTKALQIHGEFAVLNFPV